MLILQRFVRFVGVADGVGELQPEQWRWKMMWPPRTKEGARHARAGLPAGRPVGALRQRYGDDAELKIHLFICFISSMNPFVQTGS